MQRWESKLFKSEATNSWAHSAITNPQVLRCANSQIANRKFPQNTEQLCLKTALKVVFKTIFIICTNFSWRIICYIFKEKGYVFAILQEFYVRKSNKLLKSANIICVFTICGPSCCQCSILHITLHSKVETEYLYKLYRCNIHVFFASITSFMKSKQITNHIGFPFKKVALQSLSYCKVLSGSSCF